MMNGSGKSDRPVIPTKPPNDAGRPVEDAVEGRGRTEGNSRQQNASRTQRRTHAPSAPERVRHVARRDTKVQFTALLHRVYDVARLCTAFLALKKDAAPGVNGETWRHDEQAREANLHALSQRLGRGAYRAKPVRRAYIPKADGRQRPLGVRVVEDKIVQRATLQRPGQRHRLAWARLWRDVEYWLPPPRVCPPYPLRRPGVITCGGSRMREIRTSGTVEGVFSNGHTYSDSRTDTGDEVVGVGVTIPIGCTSGKTI